MPSMVVATCQTREETRPAFYLRVRGNGKPGMDE